MTDATLQKNSGGGNRGYTLLFAVLVSSLVLAIGLSILTLARKEFLLATSARDSSIAFYAADSALECALNADQNRSAFWTLADHTADKIRENVNSQLGCIYALPAILVEVNTDNPNDIWFTYDLSMGTTDTSGNFISPANGPCARVIVRKMNDGTNLSTDFEARGYNTGWNPAPAYRCELQGPKRVERAIHYKY